MYRIKGKMPLIFWTFVALYGVLLGIQFTLFFI